MGIRREIKIGIKIGITGQCPRRSGWRAGIGWVWAVAVWMSVCPCRSVRADAGPSAATALRFETTAGQLVIRRAHSGEQLAQLRLSGEVRAFCAVGSSLFVARAGRGVAIVDVSSPSAPREVGTLADDLWVGRMEAAGDLLQLRSPSGNASASYRVQPHGAPLLLRRLHVPSDDEDDDDPQRAADLAGVSGPPRPSGQAAPATWLALRLRDGSRALGQLLPSRDDAYLSLRLANRAILTVARSEIMAIEVVPRPLAARASLSTPAPPSPTLTARPAEHPLLLAPAAATVVGERRYTVDGVHFQIWRSRAGQAERLGETQLPAVADPSAIVRGRAAYIRIPHHGLVVVDIGLSRYPYVLWHLLPQHAVARLHLQGDRLHVSTDRQAFVYDLSDPLLPQGAERFPYAPRRHYAGATELISDGTWQDLGILAPVAGRRMYLRDGRVLLGTWRSETSSGGITLDILGSPLTIARRDIMHSEPVELPPELSPPPQTGTQPAAAPAQRLTAGRQVEIAGALVLVIGSAVALATVGIIFFVNFRLGGVPTYATEPRSGSALRPPLVAPQAQAIRQDSWLLRVRF